MTIIIDQKAATEEFLSGCKIHKTRDDSRGWYICNHYGHLYLHSDGTISNGIRDDSAFWGTEEQATEFYNNWKQKKNKKLQMGACNCQTFSPVESWECDDCGTLSHMSAAEL